MACRWTELVIDANDPVGLAGFWSRVLDYPITDQDEHYAEIAAPAGPSIVFVEVPEPKTVKGPHPHRRQRDRPGPDGRGRPHQGARRDRRRRRPARAGARPARRDVGGARRPGGQRVLRSEIPGGSPLTWARVVYSALAPFRTGDALSEVVERDALRLRTSMRPAVTHPMALKIRSYPVFTNPPTFEFG